jgi:predicted Ser/Thr protein kinase
MMTAREKLLAEVEAFLEKTGMRETTFGFETVNDPALVSDLRNGRNVRIDTAEKLRNYIAKNRGGKPRPKSAGDRTVAA